MLATITAPVECSALRADAVRSKLIHLPIEAAQEIVANQDHVDFADDILLQRLPTDTLRWDE
jgi:hypothetical protein